MATISQEAKEIGPLRWTEGDPVSLAWYVDADWAGEYTSQIRTSRDDDAVLIGAFEVTAVPDVVAVDGVDVNVTLFNLTMTEAKSLLIQRGKYVCDVQQVNGVTRVWAKIIVGPQVTVP